MSEENGQAKRIGLFGGTFNPLHMGHLNAITTVRSRLKLDKIVVLPAAQNPLKPAVEGPSNEQRLEMLKRGLDEFSFIEIDDRELSKPGPSYTVDTLEAYAKDHDPEDLYLIVGLDQFEVFDKWKSYERILELANLVVVSRPKHSLPFGEEDLPAGIRKLVGEFDRQFIALSTGRSIEFVRLQDVDVSSTEVRKYLRTGRNVDRHISIKVEEYIREQGIYAPIGPKIGDYEQFTDYTAQALFAKKGINVKAFDLRGTEAPCEFAVIASGTSTRHASSLAEAVQKAVKDEYNVYPQGIEGVTEGRWVVLDYGATMVHVFYDFVRQEYRLEDLWKPGRDMQIREKAPAPVAGT